jgi:TonB family protein
MFGVQRNWHIRAAAIGGVVLIHVIVIFSILQRRAERNTEAGSRGFLSPITSERGEQTAGGVSRSQNPTERRIVGEAVADSRWRFPAVDIYPSHVKAVPSTELSSFTGRSATPLQPIAPPPGSNNTRIPASSTLRLVRWMRPDYSLATADAGEEGTALIEMRIDESGNALEIHLVRGTGFADLDEATLAAARVWTFAPPLNHSQPVRTRAEIEIHFHAQ